MAKTIDGITRTASALTGTERFALRDGTPDPDDPLDAKATINQLPEYIFSEIGSLTEQTAAEDTNLVPILDGTVPKYMSLTTLSAYMQNLIATQRRGTIQLWGAATAPTGALLCDGAAVSRTTYAALFAIYGDTFGAGDGSTTFNLPDFQGRSPKGVGTSSGGTDVTHVAETITLATKNNDKFQGHYQNRNTAGSSEYIILATAGAIQVPGGGTATLSSGATTGSPITDGTNGTPRTGTTTTGKTLGINFIVWY